MRRVPRQICTQNQNTFYVQELFCENRAVFMSQCGKKYGRTRQATDGNIIRRMRTARRIPKPTDTHSEYLSFSTQQWSQECVSMLRLRALPVFFPYKQKLILVNKH